MEAEVSWLSLSIHSDSGGGGTKSHAMSHRILFWFAMSASSGGCSTVGCSGFGKTYEANPNASKDSFRDLVVSL
jgi:hypothetical protein